MRSSSTFDETQPRPLFESAIVQRAFRDAFRKLNPLHQMKNPVMFTVWVGSALTTLLYAQALLGHGEARPGFILAIALWLWFTLIFANFAEAMAEGRGKAQADSLRRSKKDVSAKLLLEEKFGSPLEAVEASCLRIGDVVLVEAGDTIISFGLEKMEDEILRKKSEAAVRASEERFRAIFREAAISIFLMEPGGRMLATNRAMQACFEYGEEEFSRMHYGEIVNPDDAPSCMGQFEGLFSGALDATPPEVKRYIRKSGQPLWGSLVASAIRSSGGEIDPM